jgi:hypothetical protein
MTARLRHRALMLTIWSLIVAWVVVTFWLVRPYSSISASPFVTDRTTYAAGDTVVMSNRFCWDGTPFRSLRVIVGTISENELGAVRFPSGYVLPEVEARYAATGCTDTTVRVQIPVTQPPGMYRFRYESTYEPHWNPVRVVEFDTESNQFEVTAR